MPIELLLLGGGHAHVEVLRRFAARPEPGLSLTLVARERWSPYTGMLPGLIRGECRMDEAHIDLVPLAAAARARFVAAAANGIDLDGRRVMLASREAIGFDLLSLDVGGLPAMPAGAGLPVRPIGGFLARLTALEAGLPDDACLAVVGGGAGGAELALALARRLAGRARIMLVSGTATVPAEAPAGARRMIRRALVAAGITVVTGVRADGFADGALELSDGRRLPVRAALWANGVVAPGWLAASGLACDAAGCVRVDAMLRSVSHAAVFAAGDCAALADARPKAGVWAVRAGPPLAAALRQAAMGRQPVAWRPQRRALAILGLGNGRAVAWRGRLWAGGRLVARWKDWIDRRWIARYRDSGGGL